MQFLKVLFWCLLAFLAAVFTIGNWTTVPIKLWGGLIAEVNLPVLLFFTFLLGFLPTLLFHHAVRWRLRSRLSSAERTVNDLRAPPPPPVAAAPVVVSDDAPVPSLSPTVDVPPQGDLLDKP